MARRKKRRMAAQSKRGKMRSKLRKTAIARPAKRKKKTATKKRRIKTAARKRPSQRPKKPQRSRHPTPVVVDTIVDIIDEPLPGVMQVTEIEEVGVAVPEDGDDKQEEE
jgi:hypothetical protein